jgi:acyl-CoA oxidase
MFQIFSDPAMTTKMTVQFNLFGGTVFKLGTEKHHEQLLKGMNNEQIRTIGLIIPITLIFF